MTQKAPGRSHRTGMTMELLRRFPDDATGGVVRGPALAGRAVLPGVRIGEHCHRCEPQAHAYRCRDCRQHFSVRKGTVMQSSKLVSRNGPSRSTMMTTGIKGTSSMKLYREVGIRQATAWFLMQRIREGFIEGRDKPFPGPVEADETAAGGKRKNISKAKRQSNSLGAVLSARPRPGVKDRPSKRVSAAVVERTDAKTLQKFVTDRTEETATVYTDDASAHTGITREHEAVRHSVGEYVRGEASTNGMEAFWSLFKRGYHGTFHHLSEKHLDRYVQEFAERNNIRDLDTLDQMAVPARGFVGKRIRYANLVA